MKIAIVGAGIAGLSCAETLRFHGYSVVLFDKGRGPGGRMATRRVTTSLGEVAFDHGAQYFTVRDPAFAERVAQWQAADVVAAWPRAGNEAWVGTPSMSAVAKAIAQPMDVQWNAQVGSIRRIGTSWALDPISDELFDAIVVATPAEQAAPLLVAHDPAMAAMAQAWSSAPCWTAMVAFDERIAVSADIIRDTGILAWAARNSAKPGRGRTEAWVLQATAEWSRHHLEHDQTGVVNALLSALAAEATQRLPEPTVRIGHRRRYARTNARHHGALWNAKTQIGAVGDWLLAPRVESAWLCGRKLAEQIHTTPV